MRLPYIPEDAPFSGDQRAWLSGFLAGLHSRQAMGAVAVAPAVGARPKTLVNVLYGTQTGNSEMLAEEVATRARAMGFDARVQPMDDVTPDALAAMRHAILICSTYGEGEMPDSAALFWDALTSSAAPRLEGLHYAVLALGDTGYDGFCQAGKLMDTRLAQLGAQRMAERVDCDIDFEAPANAWIAATLPLIGGKAEALVASTAPAGAKPGYSRKAPFAARLAVNRLLSGAHSSKEIRHYEFDLGTSGLSYEAGDALGVVPVNDPGLVASVLEQVGAGPDTLVAGQDRPFGTLLTDAFEIVTPSREMVAAIGARANDEALSHVLAGGDREALDAWLRDRDLLDLLRMLPKGGMDAGTLTGLLKPLQHRAYSISSSPKEAAGSVHLTVASVRWRAEGRAHGGVCSTFLADRAGETAGIFVQPNKAFRPPVDDEAPMIMVGPGTGIAPFRAFLQERRARGAKGRNWLFFGDQHRESDFIYDGELSGMAEQGLLTRLDLAFSRDQAQKVYVQTRMRENGKALFSWLEEGGCFYVCGDATRMARDVDTALHEIIATHGGLGPEAATDYANGLKRAKRYLRDVY
ncbi:diflavin oxidoreductase [Pseudogemmobacter bohemicus]|uniref:diflavin oxidoreductase n=1 Tax=Pseudogemmobacter bohemicus TaxID=2250708 RepID=UPI000DD32393|nr:sulfite reductase flavoprotein subunit alpha [Pseudogemmobacter bohemicus]